MKLLIGGFQWRRIPLLCEEGWRDSRKADAPGWSVRPKRFAALFLRLRPVGLALGGGCRASPPLRGGEWTRPKIDLDRGVA